MASLRLKQTIISLLGIVFVSAVLVQCTKDNVNASLIDRDLPSVPDSSIFAPFYDTVLIDKRDLTPDVNDTINAPGVQSTIKSYCASPACHGGNIEPRLTSYAEIKSLVIPGNPEGSRLMELITTTDVAKAMPPVNYGADLSSTEKTIVYNWIRNGAKERPDLADFRPAAITLISNGCASANCHNEATAAGGWARKGIISFASTDTVNFSFTQPDGVYRNYCQLKEPKLSEVWKAYKDSTRKFYTDTVSNASFRPYKTVSTPVSAASTRGPLNNYDDILFDIWYPKGVRTQSRVVYTDPVTLKGYYVQGDYLVKAVTASATSTNPVSSLISRIDSTLLVASPRTKVFNTVHHGDMAYGDGGLTRSEIALIKAWYFADPNVPDVWKYGMDGTGIFKYRKSGTIIRK
jgi:Planctomycete cytochrome C